MFTGESGAVAASKTRIWATFSPRKVILVATIRYRYTMRSVEVELSQYGVCSTVAERSRLVLVGLNHYYLALASAVRLIDTHYTDLLRSYACIRLAKRSSRCRRGSNLPPQALNVMQDHWVDAAAALLMRTDV
jgi:hypothetical protein